MLTTWLSNKDLKLAVGLPANMCNNENKFHHDSHTQPQQILGLRLNSPKREQLGEVTLKFTAGDSQTAACKAISLNNIFSTFFPHVSNVFLMFHILTGQIEWNNILW